MFILSRLNNNNNKNNNNDYDNESSKNSLFSFCRHQYVNKINKQERNKNENNKRRQNCKNCTNVILFRYLPVLENNEEKNPKGFRSKPLRTPHNPTVSKHANIYIYVCVCVCVCVVYACV